MAGLLRYLGLALALLLLVLLNDAKKVGTSRSSGVPGRAKPAAKAARYAGEGMDGVWGGWSGRCEVVRADTLIEGDDQRDRSDGLPTCACLHDWT